MKSNITRKIAITSVLSIKCLFKREEKRDINTMIHLKYIRLILILMKIRMQNCTIACKITIKSSPHRYYLDIKY